MGDNDKDKAVRPSARVLAPDGLKKRGGQEEKPRAPEPIKVEAPLDPPSEGESTQE